jgi:hypothetical protein
MSMLMRRRERVRRSKGMTTTTTTREAPWPARLIANTPSPRNIWKHSARRREELVELREKEFEERQAAHQRLVKGEGLCSNEELAE